VYVLHFLKICGCRTTPTNTAVHLITLGTKSVEKSNGIGKLFSDLVSESRFAMIHELEEENLKF